MCVYVTTSRLSEVAVSFLCFFLISQVVLRLVTRFGLLRKNRHPTLQVGPKSKPLAELSLTLIKTVTEARYFFS